MAEEITEITDNTKEEKLPEGIVKTEITGEMKKAYLDYAMSVIVSRALPDVRDGLKPVQRRIIFSMQEQNMSAEGKFHKSATVVGNVLSKYHPHGDTAVYDALVRMAQDFSLRYQLIHGQGNFGSIDGDPPAAMRYTEVKLQKISKELYRDIENDTVDFELNDLQNPEPKFLPSVLPNILLNGASGIAVGMATNIPPHNLGEIIEGINLLIENAESIGEKPTDKDTQKFKAFEGEEGAFTVKISKTDFSSSATVEDLVQIIKGPDFPTGGIIYDHKEIIQAYATGKGSIVTRALMEIEELKGGKMRIVVSEIPYQVNKATLMEKIASLVKSRKIEGIADLRDESSREGLRIVIELKREAIPQKIQNQLYKYTPLQTAFNANMVALLNGEPKLMTLKMILEEFVKHRQIVIVKRAIHLLKKAKAREHILLGLKKALDNLDAVIKLIRSSPDADKAKESLMKKFGLTEIQAQAILDMQLRRLAALERNKIDEELKEITKTIGDFEELLSSPKKIISVVLKELNELKDKCGDERKTKVTKGKVGKLSEEDLIVNEPCFVTVSKNGYIKRMKESTYRKQGRGGKGVRGQSLREEDIISTIRTCHTHDYAFFFTNKGKVYKMRTWDIPETSRTAKGTALVNFLNIGQDEKVQAFLTMTPEHLENEEGFIVFGTRKGIVKKTSLADYENIRTTGIMAIKLSQDDNLVWASLSSGKDQIMMISASGQAIRFDEKDVRPMGRVARGVLGIRLKLKDYIVGTVVIPKGEKLNLITITENGYGKKTDLSEYKVQKRGGSGIKTHNVSKKIGSLITSRIESQKTNSDILLITTSGNVIRLSAKQISRLGRATIGVRLIRLNEKDKVASTAFIDEEDGSKK